MGKKRVCHVTSVHPADDIRILHKECVSLSNAGYEVYLVAPEVSNQLKNGIQIIGVPNKPVSRFHRILFYIRYVYKKALWVNADIYHLHDPELLLYALLLKKRGKIVIFDSHEDIPRQILSKEWIPFFIRKFISFSYTKYEKFILKQLDAIVTVNQDIASRLVQYNKRTYVVSNYPVFRNNVERSSVMERTIGFAGNIKQEYMHENILIALTNLGNVRYLLAGNAEEGYLKQLQTFKGWDFVDFYGRISKEKVLLLYDKIAIGMAIHDYTLNVGGKKGGLGFIKNFEYMEAGIPLVCTDFDIWKEIVEEYYCGICVNPHDVNSITGAIQYLIDNPVIARKMGDNGRRAVKEKFNWKTQEEILLQLYDSL